MKISLGIDRYTEQKIDFDTDYAINKHIFIAGSSGTGKSVEGQKLLIEIVEHGGTVIAFDSHQVLAWNEIYLKHRSKFCAKTNEIRAYGEGIKCNLFKPMVHLDGTVEHSFDAVNAFVDVVDRIAHLGSRQKTNLRMATNDIVEQKAYEKRGFCALAGGLDHLKTPEATQVKEKIYPLLIHNVFRPGELFIREGTINIVRLNIFDLETQKMIIEILLAYIWRMALTNCFKDKNVFLYIDECQNMSFGKRDILPQILSEGRKFGVNLILITQQLPHAREAANWQGEFQSGLFLQFRPTADKIRMAAKMIDPENTAAWMEVLRYLERGEFVASGALEIAGRHTKYPLLVSAYE